MQKNAALPTAALMSVQTSNLSIKYAPSHLFFSICADIHIYIHLLIVALSKVIPWLQQQPKTKRVGWRFNQGSCHWQRRLMLIMQARKETGRGLKKGEKQKWKKSDFRCCLTLCLQREREREKKLHSLAKKMQLNWIYAKLKAQHNFWSTRSLPRFWWKKLVLWKREREIERFPFQWCTYTLRSSWISKNFASMQCSAYLLASSWAPKKDKCHKFLQCSSSDYNCWYAPNACRGERSSSIANRNSHKKTKPVFSHCCKSHTHTQTYAQGERERVRERTHGPICCKRSREEMSQ